MLRLMLAIPAVLLAGPTLAATILLKTGWDGGEVLAPGALDPNWEIKIASAPFQAARVAFSAQICCGMNTVGDGAAWVTDQSVRAHSPATGWGQFQPVGLRTTFDLSTADLDTVSLSGKWRIADYARGLYLNGKYIPYTTVDLTQPGGASFVADRFFLPVTSGFVQGQNTLLMVGESGNGVWDAFWFDGRVDYQELPSQSSAVPLPAAGVMLFSALALMAGLRRRRPCG